MNILKNMNKIEMFLATVVLYTIIYQYLLGPDHFNGLDENSGVIDYLYFSTVSQSSVGYGDISPKSSLARLIVSLQIITGLIIIFSVIKTPFLNLRK